MFSEDAEFGRGRDVPAYSLLAVRRDELIASLCKDSQVDITVVGGGIHGAQFARVAALNGFSTVLLERDDYAGATSSRTSKMAHGGLRYLEYFDFAQVFDGIRAREDLFQVAPHLVRPQQFFIPQFQASLYERVRMAIGLRVYDWFLRDKSRRSRAAKIKEIPLALFDGASRQPTSGFLYFDGIMRDTRLVMENILAARQEGARCINYARVDSIHHTEGSPAILGWTDVLSGNKYELRTGIVVNCAGPWVPHLGRLPGAADTGVRYSQGAHLLFRKSWQGPALFLPLGRPGQYYFVWPHFAGTMVGTTETEVPNAPVDPQPQRIEVDELLQRLARDVPGAGLDRSSLHYAFAGVRTLVRSTTSGSTTELSRRPVWSYGRGILSLVGGKFTTAALTAFDGLQQVAKLTQSDRTLVSILGRTLPGAARYQERCADFYRQAEELGRSSLLTRAVIARYGALVKYFPELDPELRAMGDTAFESEVAFACEVEQAERLEDIMRRRLELEYLPDHGMQVVPRVLELLQQRRPQLDIKAEAQSYQKRLAELGASLR